MKPGRRWSGEVRDTVSAVEQEMRQVVSHVNDKIVPEVRASAITAMRGVAGSLRQLADWLDESSGATRA